MFLIVGLGNPGTQYKNNRHNVGFLFLDYLANKHSLDSFKKKNKYHFTKGLIAGSDVILLKPQTFMNLSGLAITSAMAFFKIKPENILVIYDDIALPFETIRIREKGSSGGHNGLKSIEKELGRQSYKRIRVGVDSPKVEGVLADFVLGNFSSEQLTVLNDFVFKIASKATELIIDGNIEQAMGTYNGKNKG